MELAGGRYVLHEALGAGGAATVYRAWDNALQVPRAVKLLHELPTDALLGDRRRILAEARAMARLDHPNVLRVHDIGVEGHRDYVVMDLAEGGSLADHLESGGPLSPAQALRYGVQVLAALAAAHRAGIVHRDIKPQNVLLSRDGTALLGDFGIALVADDAARATRTGTAMGSLAFMAPEQRLDARSVGPAADLYGLGATLYALMTGRNPVDLFAAKADNKRWAGLDPTVVAVLSRATRYRPEDRYPDAAAMAADVLALLDRADEVALPLSADDAALYPERTGPLAPAPPIGPGTEGVDQAIAALGALGVTASDPGALITLASQLERDPAPAVAIAGPEARVDRGWQVALAVVVALLLVGAGWFWLTAALGSAGSEAAAEVATAAAAPHPQFAPDPVPRPDLVAEPAPPTTGTEAGSAAAVHGPDADQDPGPSPRSGVEAAPSPKPAPPVAPAGPAPLGTWTGTFDGRPVTVSLSGSVDRPVGRVVVRAAGAEVATPVTGTWEPTSRKLVLQDEIDASDAGSYALTLDPDLSRMQGTWSARHRSQVLPIALRLAN